MGRIPLTAFVLLGGIAASSGVFGMVIANRFLDRPHPLRYRFGIAVVAVSTVLGATILTPAWGGHAVVPLRDLLLEWVVSLSIELVAEVVCGLALSPILLRWLQWLEPPEILREYDRTD